MQVKKIILTLLAVVCVLSCLTLPALAAESVPDVPKFPRPFTNAGYLLYEHNGNIQLLMYDKDKVELKVDRSVSLLYLDFYSSIEEGTHYADTYRIADDGGWTLNSSMSFVDSFGQGYHRIMHNFSNIYYSTVDIMDANSSGAVFFPQTLLPTPLWAEVIAVTEANKNLLSQTKTISILVLCGVGLMALLLGLNLLVKVFNRFQAR